MEENQEDNTMVLERHILRQSTRADIVHPSRLQGFADAVFATAATLLIVPVRRFEIEDGETLKEALLRHYPLFLVFLFGYLVITSIWESHIIRYKVIEKVDDFLVGMNLISLMIVTFLPFSVALEGHYGKYQTPVLLNGFLLLGLELCEAAVFIYAFMNPRILTTEFCQLDPAEKKIKKYQIFIKIILNCALYGFAMVFSFASFVVAWILICSVILRNFRNGLLIHFTKVSARCRCHSTNSTFEVLTGRIDKERIEYFSDAAIAIVATLLILDLTTEDFPSNKEVAKDGLVKTLATMYQRFVSYIGTYTTIAFLWFIHHSVLQHIKLFTPLMAFTNKIFLALLAFIPFLSTLTNKYSGHVSDDARIAVSFSSIVLFFGSFSNVLLLVFAMLNARDTLHDWAQPAQHGNKALIYLTLKTLIIPLTTFITYIVSIFSNVGSYWVFHVFLFTAPVLFIVLKILFACHWQQDNTPNNTPNTSREGSVLNVSISDGNSEERQLSIMNNEL